MQHEQLLQFGIVMAFGALCFGCGCLTAFIDFVAPLIVRHVD